MSKLLYVEPRDEITDLIDRIRRSESEQDLVFVLAAESRVLRTPLDARLLMQYGRGFHKRIAVVSAEPQIQALAIRAGFPTFTSLSALEQGTALSAATVAETVGGTAVGAAAAASAAAVSSPPRGSQARTITRRPSAQVAEAGAAGAGAAEGGRLGNWWRSARASNWTLGVGGAVFVVGLLAVLLLLPTATLVVGVQAHKLVDNVTIQGSSGGLSGNTLDQISTESLLTPTASQTFTATPSGTQVLPPTSATGNLYFCYSGPPTGPVSLSFTGSPDFQVGGSSVAFTTTSGSSSGSYMVSACPNPHSPAASSSTSQAVPVQADSSSLGAQGNLGSGQQWSWPNQETTGCVSGFCGVNNVTFYMANPAAMSGGAASKTETVFTSSDVASAQQQEQQIAATLTSKVENNLKNMAGTDIIAEDSSGNGIQISVTNPTLPTAGQAGSAQTLTVSANASATAYSKKAAQAAVLADLKSKIPSDAELLPHPKLGDIQVISAGPGGSLTLSTSAVGYWAPRVDLGPFRSKVTFMSPGSARSYLLSELPGASTVSVHQSPFGLPWLPPLSGRIQIVRMSLDTGSGSG